MVQTDRDKQTDRGCRSFAVATNTTWTTSSNA